MNWQESFNRFDLYNDRVVNDEIEAVDAFEQARTKTAMDFDGRLDDDE